MEGSSNIRELGGIRIKGGEIQKGRILRGEAPSLLPPSSVEELYEYGVRTFIDLRGPSEVKAQGKGHAATLVSNGLVRTVYASLTPGAAWKDSHKNENPYDNLGAVYVACLEARASALVTALLEGLENGCVYMHCAAGKDRTGIAVAAILDALGAGREDVTADFMQTSTGFPSIVSKLSNDAHYPEFKNPDWAKIMPREDVIKDALLTLDAMGGAGKFFEAAGLTSNLREHLREQLLKAKPQ